MDDTPADMAGVEPGDLITHVDGEPLLGPDIGRSRPSLMRRPGRVRDYRDKSPAKVWPNRFDPVHHPRPTIRLQAVRVRSEGDTVILRLTTF